MGLYDHVHVNGPEFVCSEGHDLSDEEFQSKDFGCTMGDVNITPGAIAVESGDWGDPPARPLLGRFSVYTSCRQCPAFVQANTLNLIECWVEFEIEVVDDAVRRIERVSASTAEWLRDTPAMEWMRGSHGPMTHAEAEAMHRNWRP